MCMKLYATDVSRWIVFMRVSFSSSSRQIIQLWSLSSAKARRTFDGTTFDVGTNFRFIFVRRSGVSIEETQQTNRDYTWNVFLYLLQNIVRDLSKIYSIHSSSTSVDRGLRKYMKFWGGPRLTKCKYFRKVTIHSSEVDNIRPMYLMSFRSLAVRFEYLFDSPSKFATNRYGNISLQTIWCCETSTCTYQMVVFRRLPPFYFRWQPLMILSFVL